tara:strand:- start:2773 stop:3231 length:459 start_codon:yes stop_codon:yes gene_type:complete
MTTINPEIKLETYKTKTTYKKKSLIGFLFFLVIVLSILAAGYIGPNFLSFMIFYLIFGFPLMIIYSDKIIKLIPKNIASYVIGEVEDIGTEIKSVHNDVLPIYKRDYLVFFLGISTYILSLYILFKKRDKLIGISMSVLFCSLSSIIINDIF